MASELRVDKIHNEGGDNDSGLDMSTNDVVAVKIAGSEKARVHSDGKVGIGETSPQGILHIKSADAGTTADGDADELVIEGSGNSGITIASGASSTGSIYFGDSGDVDIGYIKYNHSQNRLEFGANASEVTRFLSDGTIFIGNTQQFVDSSGSSAKGIEFNPAGIVIASRDGSVSAIFGRSSDDGQIVQLRQDGSTEGTISVSGSTVSYGGFVGLHESSGIATSTPVGTVVSTIDELDVYPVGTPKAGQNRADHAKVKVSDTVGDKRVYGVVQKFDAEYYNKLQVASVGVGSVRVTGACAGGDLLESNGDGTAKVQSDDIVRSKTIGKVTIGNSNSGVKLVSCVLYCG